MADLVLVLMHEREDGLVFGETADKQHLLHGDESGLYWEWWREYMGALHDTKAVSQATSETKNQNQNQNN